MDEVSTAAASTVGLLGVHQLWMSSTIAACAVGLLGIHQLWMRFQLLLLVELQLLHCWKTLLGPGRYSGPSRYLSAMDKVSTVAASGAAAALLENFPNFVKSAISKRQILVLKDCCTEICLFQNWLWACVEWF
jgi:hypothetical protein